MILTFVSHTWNAQNDIMRLPCSCIYFHCVSNSIDLFCALVLINWVGQEEISLLWVCRRRSVKCPLINTIIHFHLLDVRGLLTVSSGAKDDLKPFWPSTTHMRTVVRELIIYNFLVLIWCLLILEIGGWLWTYANYCILYDLQKRWDNSQRFCLNNGCSNKV